MQLYYKIIEVINKEATALAAVSTEYTTNLQYTERVLQSIQQQEELYSDN